MGDSEWFDTFNKTGKTVQKKFMEKNMLPLASNGIFLHNASDDKEKIIEQWAHTIFNVFSIPHDIEKYFGITDVTSKEIKMDIPAVTTADESKETDVKEDIDLFATITEKMQITDNEQTFNIFTIKPNNFTINTLYGFMTIKIFIETKQIYSHYTIGHIDESVFKIIVSYKTTDLPISSSTFLHGKKVGEIIKVQNGNLHHDTLGINIYLKNEYMLMLTGTAISIAFNLLSQIKKINKQPIPKITLILGVRGKQFYNYIIGQFNEYSQYITNIFAAITGVDTLDNAITEFNSKPIILKQGRIPELLYDCEIIGMKPLSIFNFIKTANTTDGNIVFVAGLDKLIKWIQLTINDSICVNNVICSY
jgi:hypothetical protein